MPASAGATFAVSFFASGLTAIGAGPANLGADGAIGEAASSPCGINVGAAGPAAGAAGLGIDGAEGAAGGESGLGAIGADGGDGGFKPVGGLSPMGGLSGVSGLGAAIGEGTEGNAADGRGAGTGFGGRLIIADSRAVDVAGCPSRRGGRTMRTVSFFGSLILDSYVIGENSAIWRFGLNPSGYPKFITGCQYQPH